MSPGREPQAETRRQLQESQPQRRPEHRFSDAVSLLRQLALRAESLTHAAKDLHDEIPRTGDKEVRRQRERLEYLIDDATDAAEQVVEACSMIAEEFIKRLPGE